MEIKKGDYVLGIWFMDKRNFGNWMLTVYKRNNEWLGEYRFRYYKDDKIFDSQDKKSFYQIKFNEEISSEEQMEQRIQETVFDFKKVYQPTENEFIEIKSDDIDKIMFEIAKAPWANIGKMSKEEAGYGEINRGNRKNSISEDKGPINRIQR